MKVNYISIKQLIRLYIFTLLLTVTIVLVTLFISNLNVELLSRNSIYKLIPTIGEKESPFVENSLRIKALELYNKSGYVGYEQFFDYVENPVTSFCRNVSNVGGRWFNLNFSVCFDPNDMELNRKNQWFYDGNKMVCLDEKIFSSQNDCIVISIGIMNEWSFDDAIVKHGLGKGCRVFAFDHTMGQQEHIRNENIYFYPYGIGKLDTNTDSARIVTISTVIDIIEQKLGRNISVISYLKMDIEGAEIEVLDYLLNINPTILKKIQQIGLEIHPSKITNFSAPSPIYKAYFDYFQRLEQRGFVLFQSSMNPVLFNRYFSPELNKYINGFYELVFGKWKEI